MLRLPTRRLLSCDLRSEPDAAVDYALDLSPCDSRLTRGFDLDVCGEWAVLATASESYQKLLR